MRGKDYNTGLRGVLFESRHYERMGSAVWLYGWLVLRQTHQHGSLGWVLGGAPISYREIEEETGFNPRTLERWMQTLRRSGYIETEAAPGGVIIWITKAKKFPQGARKIAEAARKFAGTPPQNRVADCGYPPPNLEVAARIGSSSVEEYEEKSGTRIVYKDFHKSADTCGNPGFDQALNPSETGKTEHHPRSEGRRAQDGPIDQINPALDARLLRQLLRAERDEAVRRELAVGTGPEVRRP
jgi:hypothetical protein